MNEVQQKLLEIRQRNALQSQNSTDSFPVQDYSQPMNEVQKKLLEIRARNSNPITQNFSTTTENKPKTLGDYLRSGIDKTKNFVFNDIPTGVVKGAASTIKGAAELGGKIFNPIDKLIPGIDTTNAPDKLQSVVEDKLNVPQGTLLKPSNLGQNVGYYGEKIAELATPMGLSGKAEKAVEGAKMLKSAPKLIQKIAPTIAKATTEGLTSAGITDLQTGDINEAKQAGVVGAALPIAGKLLSIPFKAALEYLPKRLVQAAVGQGKEELRAGKDVSGYILKNKKVGTFNSLLNQSEAQMTHLNGQIAKNLGQATENGVLINKNNVIGELVDKINKDGGAINHEEINSILYDLVPQARGLLQKETLNPIEANRLRQLIDRTVGDRNFLKNQLPFKQDVLRDFSNNLRETVKQNAPENTRGLFDDLSKEITLRNALVKKYGGNEGKSLVKWGDILAALPGSFGGIPGVVGSVAAKRAVESPYVLTGVANNLSKIKELTPILNKLAPVEKAAIIKVLQGR